MKKTTLLTLLSILIISTSYSCKQEESKSLSLRENTRNNQSTQYSDPNIINVSDYSCYKTDMDICKIEATIFRGTNAYRQTKGKKTFQPSLLVSYIARNWSQKLAEKKEKEHGGFNSDFVISVVETLDNPLDADKIEGKFLAENVADVHSGVQDIGKNLTKQWIDSPSHERNIMDSSNQGYTYLGIGVSKSNNGYYYATQIFAK